jgi:AcrR family transcriptional regulator
MPTDRRTRYREFTKVQAKRVAMEQLAEHGVAGVSVNAIGKRLGLTGPAMYRYFTNRDELLAELITDGYADLADAMAAAITGARGPEGALRALATAVRDWALAQPHHYMLLYGWVPGREMTESMRAEANRGIGVVLSIVDKGQGRGGRRSALQQQVTDWAERSGFHVADPRALVWTFTVLTRVHGLITTELSGQFHGTGIDPALLYDAEVDALVSALVKA